MSDSKTPRTDEYVGHWVPADFARELERENQELATLLQESKRAHSYCEDSWYSCPMAEDGCANEAEGTECNCGATAWNARVDAALAKRKEST